MAKNWKTMFEPTKAKIISFVVVTAIWQFIKLSWILNPICLGPCGDHMYAFSWQIQQWVWTTFVSTLIILVAILFVSFLYHVIKEK